ncbi:MAG: hypothetical protein EPO02_03525 [Nitrospirae bacterium]|nr:MAG: hypothetical protein EPO02_03525 [Nitrospirota bacterium]
MPTPYARNWISYLTDSLVNDNALPAGDAVEYLTQNLFGDSPNRRLHEAKVPHEAIAQFLQRLYGPLLEAATREAGLAEGDSTRIFTDVSLIGPSTVLAVYAPANDGPQQLLLLDSVRTWDLVFPHADAFNAWAEERYGKLVAALHAPVGACALPA